VLYHQHHQREGATVSIPDLVAAVVLPEGQARLAVEADELAEVGDVGGAGPSSKNAGSTLVFLIMEYFIISKYRMCS
jgi:hypothetical protein